MRAAAAGGGPLRLTASPGTPESQSARGAPRPLQRHRTPPRRHEARSLPCRLGPPLHCRAAQRSAALSLCIQKLNRNSNTPRRARPNVQVHASRGDRQTTRVTTYTGHSPHRARARSRLMSVLRTKTISTPNPLSVRCRRAHCRHRRPERPRLRARRAQRRCRKGACSAPRRSSEAGGSAREGCRRGR